MALLRYDRGRPDVYGTAEEVSSGSGNELSGRMRPGALLGFVERGQFVERPQLARAAELDRKVHLAQQAVVLGKGDTGRHVTVLRRGTRRNR